MALHDATIRDAACTILLAAGTIAGARVQREWIDNPADSEMPRLAVMADSAGQSLSAVGGPPVFEVTGDLVIVAQVAEAHEGDAISALDQLAEQARDALLCSPSFFALAAVKSWRVVRTFKNNGKLIIGDCRIILNLGWKETIQPVSADLPIFTGADIHSGAGPAIGANVVINS